ncbi:TPA: restriction endonuclease subunit S [Staphylococcus argenteus]|uniref:restriction endonuclease subunit S n=2 Tax=Staphylococcus argenteus TaxID=985002 RepID=UPI000504FBFE|nr:restriction endonuclease subunit S [Staphylococcus argenteus]MDT3006442.1 restriction endonuclease subunit S [Staphylococcus argenteus]UPO21212.1 restriction endonuclease subunit S [Staphylococcus argenteus]CDR65129.1 type-I specificity determinant subunit [Staphylococcus argenteus]HDY9445844.1 restriction endonuclease subunit S [Staphylococcus argenteus]HDY9492416.1 restriction endonuclease subunit S [Staphylococcus argenteus]
MSNTQKKNVPELRFPEFESEWEEKELGDVASFAKGKLGAKKDVSKTGVPIILYGELYTKYGAIVSKIFSKTDIPENKLKMASKNDVLIPSSGETAIDIATASCVYLNKGVAVGGDINILKPQKQDGRFISLSINGINKNELSKYAQGKTVVHLYNNDIKNLKIAFPSQFDEQQKIGDLFSELDRQIGLEEQKLELLQQQKKGYMQKIFSQELRFKDENGNDYPEWEKKKLQQIIEVKDGTHESPKPTDNGYLLVTSKNLKNNKLDFSESYSISKEDYESINKRSKVEKGDILFGMIGTIGNPILLEDEGFAIKNVALLKTSCLQEKYYILNFLKSIAIAKQFYKTNAGGTQKFISLGAIRDLKIDFPSLEESTKIGILFNKLDELIKNQSIKIVLLRRRKKALLKSMFI